MPRCRISGRGVICALGNDVDTVMAAIARNISGLIPLKRFPVPHVPPLPAGQVQFVENADIPLTHQLARIAADQAMSACRSAPDAVVLGITTGGMATTEPLLKQNCLNINDYRHHAIGSVAEDLARRFHCTGPVLTVSTACSSGSAALAIAMAMIRSGRFRRVLTGGADALCRLTYYGFKSLQLIDPGGCRPLDAARKGMSVAEGAGMLLLEGVERKSSGGVEILGAGLSCDAHHPAQPHPEGRGALAAMKEALFSAGLDASAIDYINLHGTGTMDNDSAESRAINDLFDHRPPPLSSIKGATGHSLAAAGAIEAVIASCCIETGIIPANTGCVTLDPLLDVTPVSVPAHRPIATVLSNSFGFGGNNAAIVIGRPSCQQPESSKTPTLEAPLTIVNWSALTGAGLTDRTIQQLCLERCCAGMYDSRRLCQGLEPGVIRRIKRLSQIALALYADAYNRTGGMAVGSVFFGTGWGSLSETNDLLTGLFESGEKFSSPTDFIGSVHNAAAGQIGLMAKATGANLTLSGGDYSFEQALFCAQLMTTANEPVLVAAADEGHDKLSGLFDPSVAATPVLSDGGGALILKRTPDPLGPRINLTHFSVDSEDHDIQAVVDSLGGAEAVNDRYGFVLYGIPAACRKEGRRQLDQFLEQTAFSGKSTDYRRLTGEFATASAVATAWAAAMVGQPSVSYPCAGEKSVLVLGLGNALSAIEVSPS